MGFRGPEIISPSVTILRRPESRGKASDARSVNATLKLYTVTDFESEIPLHISPNTAFTPFMSTVLTGSFVEEVKSGLSFASCQAELKVRQ